jgi:hypothetical protein
MVSLSSCGLPRGVAEIRERDHTTVGVRHEIFDTHPAVAHRALGASQWALWTDSIPGSRR